MKEKNRQARKLINLLSVLCLPLLSIIRLSLCLYFVVLFAPFLSLLLLLFLLFLLLLDLVLIFPRQFLCSLLQTSVTILIFHNYSLFLLLLIPQFFFFFFLFVFCPALPSSVSIFLSLDFCNYPYLSPVQSIMYSYSFLCFSVLFFLVFLSCSSFVSYLFASVNVCNILIFYLIQLKRYRNFHVLLFSLLLT